MHCGARGVAFGRRAQGLETSDYGFHTQETAHTDVGRLSLYHVTLRHKGSCWRRSSPTGHDAHHYSVCSTDSAGVRAQLLRS